MKEITIVSKDRIGLLADVSQALAEKNINIESVSVETSGRTAIIRIVTNQEKKADSVLENAGFKPVGADVLVVRLVDRPGELAKTTRLLADNRINIENVFLLNKEGRESVFALRVSDYQKAKKLLGV